MPDGTKQGNGIADSLARIFARLDEIDEHLRFSDQRQDKRDSHDRQRAADTNQIVGALRTVAGQLAALETRTQAAAIDAALRDGEHRAGLARTREADNKAPSDAKAFIDAIKGGFTPGVIGLGMVLAAALVAYAIYSGIRSIDEGMHGRTPAPAIEQGPR